MKVAKTTKIDKIIDDTDLHPLYKWKGSWVRINMYDGEKNAKLTARQSFTTNRFQTFQIHKKRH